MARRPILDQGYLELIDCWGSDERVVEAARMSTQGGFVSWDPYEGHPRGDLGLLSYLHSHKHTTPFEMAGLTVEVQAPIAVFREWHRHRTQSYNEASARYAPLPNVNYMPTVDRCLSIQTGNKQAAAVAGADVLNESGATLWLDELANLYEAAERVYQHGLRIGVPKELARMCMPVGRYSRMRASANLLNWLKFLALRMDAAAQWEIRQYANAIGDLIAEHFPRTWALFRESRRD